MKISKRVVVVALVIVATTVVLAIVLTSSTRYWSDVSRVQLPERGRQYQLDEHTVLYASNENLTDLLFRLDLLFKNQSLNSDASSSDFRPAKDAPGREAISNCVVFKYFSQQDNNLAAQFTLLPERPACFSKDPAVMKEVQQLYTKYQYVYAIRSF